VKALKENTCEAPDGIVADKHREGLAPLHLSQVLWRLLYDALGSQLQIIGRWMKDELERIWKEEFMT
jgi:hypothetical protein